MPKYEVGILFWDGKMLKREFLHYSVASKTINSMGDIAKRYPGTIKNVWMINQYETKR